MRVQIHYFTGTGNTKRAVSKIVDKLQHLGHQVDVCSIQHAVTPSGEAVDMHLIAFPVLSWAAPSMMLHYLKKFPKASKTKVAILAVNGASNYGGKRIEGYTGQALEQVERLLKHKGYDVFLTGNASYPENWTQMTNPCDAQTVQAILPLGDLKVEEFAESMLSNKRSLYRCGWLNYSWSWLIGRLFGLIGRRVLGTFYIADSSCTGCSLCVQTCPAKTIEMHSGRPRWKTRCEDCNRCINICPEKAIQVSLPLMLIQLTIHVLLTIQFIEWALHLSKLIRVDFSAWHLLLDILLVVLGIFMAVWCTLVPLRIFFEFMQKIPLLRSFFSKSVTKSFRRYLAPGFKASKE